uniref:Uncharacterized protein n=1 Tax=Globodera rostochiensis TaxID=31243 RepID=A0A914I1C0_GLORO
MGFLDDESNRASGFIRSGHIMFSGRGGDSLVGRMKHLLSTGNGADVHFMVGDGDKKEARQLGSGQLGTGQLGSEDNSAQDNSALSCAELSSLPSCPVPSCPTAELSSAELSTAELYARRILVQEKFENF